MGNLAIAITLVVIGISVWVITPVVSVIILVVAVKLTLDVISPDDKED